MRNDIFKICAAMGFLYVLLMLTSSLVYVFVVESPSKEAIAHVRKVCQETGMYIQDGYVISCKVLDNNE